MTDSFTPPAPLQTAVLFLVFNRPDTTAKVFEAIREAKPTKLYVAADGPRSAREGEKDRVAKVRDIATAVDWPCEIKTLFRSENLGCGKAVSDGVNWFFENEEQGIILEDDCLPCTAFFEFCEAMLERYKHESKIYAITGDNFQDGNIRGVYGYYFSRFNHIWGWASWRRAWQHYDIDMKFWPALKQTEQWRHWLTDPIERRYWQKIFDKSSKGKIDTWDYQWTASIWSQQGLTITPNSNLVDNIGFGQDATHTKSPIPANIDNPGRTKKINLNMHPPCIEITEEADRYTFDTHFHGWKRRMPQAIIYLLPRIIRLIKNHYSHK